MFVFFEPLSSRTSSSRILVIPVDSSSYPWVLYRIEENIIRNSTRGQRIPFALCMLSCLSSVVRWHPFDEQQDSGLVSVVSRSAVVLPLPPHLLRTVWVNPLRNFISPFPSTNRTFIRVPLALCSSASSNYNIYYYCPRVIFGPGGNWQEKDGTEPGQNLKPPSVVEHERTSVCRWSTQLNWNGIDRGGISLFCVCPLNSSSSGICLNVIFKQRVSFRRLAERCGNW